MSKNKLNELLQEERNKRSQELFGKDANDLNIEEQLKLDMYIHDLANPQWKPVIIDGKYKTYYEISNTGLLRNIRLNKYSKPYINHKGYEGCLIAYAGYGGNKRKNTFIHRLVATAFIPNPENKPQVNHIDGNKLNNWASNLEWVDNRENQIHAYNTGLHKPMKGIKHYNSQHSEEDVHQVCKLLEKSIPINKIAKKLNVTKAFIIGIKYQGNWEDIRSQYNIPKSNTYGDRTEDQKNMIDELILNGLRNRKEILKLVGLPDTETNISYIKYRIRIHNKNKIVKGSTTIKHSDVGVNTAS